MNTKYEFRFKDVNIMALAIVAGGLFWLVDSVLHAEVWGITSWWGSLLRGDHEQNEIYLRIVVVSMLVGLGYFADSSKQKIIKHNLKNKKISRLLGFLRTCSANIRHQDDVQGVLDGACRAAIEVGEFKLAWIAMKDADGLSLAAWASSNKTDIDEQAIQLHDHVASLNCSACWNALEHGTAQLCDVSPLMDCPAVWSEMFLNGDRGQAYIMPIKVLGQVVGIFEIYVGTFDLLSAEELVILDEAADDVSAILMWFDQEKRLELKNEEMHVRIDELEQFQKATVDREFRIKDLREENSRLKSMIKGQNT